MFNFDYNEVKAYENCYWQPIVNIYGDPVDWSSMYPSMQCDTDCHNRKSVFH